MNGERDGVLLRGPGGGSGYGTLIQNINGLKNEGCNMLVTGRVSDENTMNATRRFLGCPEESRKRVLALLDGSSRPAEDRLPGDISPGNPDVQVIDYRDNRFTAAASTPSHPGAPDTALPRERHLPEIRREILDSIEAVAAGTELEPSELRLSVETLNDFFQHHDFTEATTVLRMITSVVTEYSGMAHYHLPVPSDSETVEKLLPYFDVHVELRKRDRVQVEHRWHLPGPDEKTDWYRLGC